jgi:hypothetical protein
MIAICTHSACPLSPVGAAGSSGSSTYCLARFLRYLAFDRFDLISPDGVQFALNFTETNERAIKTAGYYRRNKASSVDHIELSLTRPVERESAFSMFISLSA